MIHQDRLTQHPSKVLLSALQNFGYSSFYFNLWLCNYYLFDKCIIILFLFQEMWSWIKNLRENFKSLLTLLKKKDVHSIRSYTNIYELGFVTFGCKKEIIYWSWIFLNFMIYRSFINSWLKPFYLKKVSHFFFQLSYFKIIIGRYSQFFLDLN